MGTVPGFCYVTKYQWQQQSVSPFLPPGTRLQQSRQRTSSPGAGAQAPRSCPFVLNTRLPPCGLRRLFLLSQKALGQKERAARGTPIPRAHAGLAQLSVLDLVMAAASCRGCELSNGLGPARTWRAFDRRSGERTRKQPAPCHPVRHSDSQDHPSSPTDHGEPLSRSRSVR